LAHGVELLRRIKRVVRVALLQQLFRIFFIDAERLAFALAVGPERAALVGALVRFETAPGQGVEDILLRTGHVPALVRIFDAEYEVAAVAPGEKIVVEDGSDAAQVQAACRAGCKSDSDFSGHRLQRY